MLKIARKTAKAILPESSVYRLKRQIEQSRFEQYTRTQLDGVFRAIAPGVVPPKALIAKTAALNERELEKQSNADVYWQTGYYEVLRVFKILDHLGINPRTIGSIYELGCGTARLLRHFRCIEGVRLVGSDVNPEMIQWCLKNIPDAEFYDNELTPPLSFANDNDFDVILASSVFTHIPLDLQESWLHEMKRVLRPGGIFICSVLGKNHISLLLDESEINQLEKTGNFTLTSEDSQATYSTRVGGSGWDVFQTRAEVIRVFGSIFQIVDYIPGGQDFLVLQKPDPSIFISVPSVPFPAERV
ncbi:class I SAM-dependent methyltransferase [Myxosarcina sp. GI1]|uniref:class I SAM-dependent methyltransferase n=1 Tax=Myxosarcina sp. GI1 TaxID=1541065 RepID=UPI00068FD34D|nr:class I SAM-dependent methyltransferase [Myxosarcina sp. GI1]